MSEVASSSSAIGISVLSAKEFWSSMPPGKFEFFSAEPIFEDLLLPLILGLEARRELEFEGTRDVFLPLIEAVFDPLPTTLGEEDVLTPVPG